MSLRAPHYGAECLDRVLPSAAAAVGVPGWVDTLGIGESMRRVGTGPRAVVVLLVDGLGQVSLGAHADLAPTLCGPSAVGRAISAAVPTTTPTGLGSLGTGLAPRAHGLVGASFRLPETGRLLHPLGWGDDPHPTAVQPEPTVFERLAAANVSVAVVAPRAYEASGLTRAALRGARYIGADSVGERVAGAVRAGARITYCYWPDLDRVGHVHGVDSPDWRAELEHVDSIVAALRRHLPADVGLVVTADHGMVDAVDRFDIDAERALRPGVAQIAGEPRFRHVYARRGAASEVYDAWSHVLGERAWVLTRQGAFDAGLLGGQDTGVDDRIGDVVALARGRTSLSSTTVDSKVSALLGQHGSITDEEIDIPLVVVG